MTAERASDAAGSVARIVSGNEAALSIALTVGDGSRHVPLYAATVPSDPLRFARIGPRTDFASPNGLTRRLVQFGNRASSKQPQPCHALRLPNAGDLAIAVRTAPGAFGPDCRLCLQVYDAADAFITQFRVALADGGEARSFKLPPRAARGCFSIELNGSGALSDIVATVSASGTPPGALRIDRGLLSLDEFRDLVTGARAGDPAADSALREAVADQQGVVVAALTKMFSNQAYYDLIHLLRLPAFASADRHGRVAPYLKYFVARGLCNLNAAVSGLGALEDLAAFPDWRAKLTKIDAQKAMLLKGQALVRCGRVDEGLAALEDARLNQPAHWEAYFLLGNNLDVDDQALKDAHYRAAGEMLGHHHAKLAVSVAENELRSGRWVDAVAHAEAALGSLEGPSDVSLALANAHLEAGDLALWRRFLHGYFDQHGLATPDLDTGAGRPDERFLGLTAAVADSDARDRGVVAVIMTTYNSAATLALSARSVLRQTYPRLRLVIVDDGSSDGTSEVAGRLAAEDGRVQLLSSPINSGTYVCKNIALSSVEADYYTFHDSDDWMHPERIARHLDAMESAEAACTTSAWFRMTANGRAVARNAGGYQHSNPASIFFRRDVLATVGYFDSVRTGADTEFTWRVRSRFPREKVFEIPLPLAIGLFHDASLTQSGVTAFNRHRFSQVRLDYWEAWVRWHTETLADDPARLHIAYPATERSFEAPEAITPEGGRALRAAAAEAAAAIRG